jgi:hypothetical protein
MSSYAVVLQHHRCEMGMQELLQYFSRKLPIHLYGPRLIDAGEQLVQRQEHRLAAELCFRRVVDLTPPSTPDSCSKLDAAGRLGLHVQALYGLHACQAAEAVLQDSQLLHQHTTSAVLAALAGLQAACEQVMPAQPMLVHAGTKHIHALTTQLAAAGLHSALPYLLFAAHAMECHISLSSPGFLPWRVQLYAAAAECYYVQLDGPSFAAVQPTDPATASPGTSRPSTADGSSTASTPAARAAQDMLAAGLAQLASVARAQALDAVPAPEVTTAIQAAQAQLQLLQCLFAQQAPAAAATEQLAAALLDTAKPVGSTRQQLAALVRLLQIGLAAWQLAPLTKVQPPACLQPVMAAAAQLAGVVLEMVSPAEQQAPAAASGLDIGQPDSSGKLHQVGPGLCLLCMCAVTSMCLQCHSWQHPKPAPHDRLQRVSSQVSSRAHVSICCAVLCCRS